MRKEAVTTSEVPEVIGMRIEVVTFEEGNYWVRARERREYDTFDNVVGAVTPVLPDDGSWRTLIDRAKLLDHFRGLIHSLDLTVHCIRLEAFHEASRELRIYRPRYMLSNGLDCDEKHNLVKEALKALHESQAS